MGILSKLLPGKTEAAIMRRTLPDGKVEYYCDRPRKSKTNKPECCAKHSAVAECLKPHEIEAEEAWSTGKREYFRLGDDLFSRPISEHARTEVTKFSRSGNQPTDNDNYNKTSSRSLTRGLVINSDNNNNVGLQAGSWSYQSRGNTKPTATPHRRSLCGNAGTLSYPEEEDLHRAIQASLATFYQPRALPRSDFTAEEQASWEERQWRGIQEEEYATARRRRRSSYSSETCRGMSSSGDGHRLRRRSSSSRNDPAYRRSIESDREARSCASSIYESCAPSEYHDRRRSDFDRENSHWYADGPSGRAFRQVDTEIYDDSFIYAGEGVHSNFQFLGYGYTD